MGLASDVGLLKSNFESREKDVAGKRETDRKAIKIKTAETIRESQLKDLTFIFGFLLMGCERPELSVRYKFERVLGKQITKNISWPEP